MTHRAACYLPKKPSELILLALADLEKAENTAGYAIKMSEWHRGVMTPPVPAYDPETCSVTEQGDPCYVCFAGSVMAFSLNVPRAVTIDPEDYPGSVAGALNALNDFRIGDVAEGLREMGFGAVKIRAVMKKFGIEREEDDYGNLSYKEIKVADYTAGARSAKFKNDMRKIARKLKSVGL